MKAFVTGGAGFIGSTLVDSLLAHGHDTYVVDDLSSGRLPNLDEARRERGVKFHRYDIAAEAVGDLLQSERPDVVFHLAAQPSVPKSVADPVHDAEVNVRGLLRILDACVAAEVGKFVYTSSGGTIYGTQTTLPIKETAVGRPISPYGISKRAGEDYIRFYKEEFGLDFTSLALANVYGPRQDPFGEGAVVSRFAQKLVKGEAPTIEGTGEQTRDLIYVEDVAHAFIRAMDRGSGETVNISTGYETSINDLYLVMADICGFDGRPQRGPGRSGDVLRSALDPGKAKKVLDWQAWTTLREGLVKTITWYRKSA
jgi:UDP-glucose 4-epimerase